MGELIKSTKKEKAKAKATRNIHPHDQATRAQRTRGIKNPKPQARAVVLLLSESTGGAAGYKLHTYVDMTPPWVHYPCAHRPAPRPLLLALQFGIRVGDWAHRAGCGERGAAGGLVTRRALWWVTITTKRPSFKVSCARRFGELGALLWKWSAQGLDPWFRCGSDVVQIWSAQGLDR